MRISDWSSDVCSSDLQSPGPPPDMSQSRIVGQHGHHHAAVPRRFPDGFGYAGPEAGDLGQLLRSAIVDNQIMVSFEQSPSHCLAHATKTYESNFNDHTP